VISKTFVAEEKKVSFTLNARFYNKERVLKEKHHIPTSSEC
jgi:hypothetical protein